MDASSCPVALKPNDVGETLARLDAAIRQSALVLVVFACVIAALIGISIFLLNAMLALYRQWRLLSQRISPHVDKDSVGTIESMGDDEIYKADIESSIDVKPSAGQRIQGAMRQLEADYAGYNKQITEYTKKVLKQKQPEDIFDRRVLDRKNDDFS
jgi:hypothetical protein